MNPLRIGMGLAHMRGFGGKPTFAGGDLGPSVWGSYNSPEQALESLGATPGKGDQAPGPAPFQKIMQAFEQLKSLQNPAAPQVPPSWLQSLNPMAFPNGQTPGFPGAPVEEAPPPDEMSSVPRAAGQPLNLLPQAHTAPTLEVDGDNNPIPGQWDPASGQTMSDFYNKGPTSFLSSLFGS